MTRTLAHADERSAATGVFEWLDRLNYRFFYDLPGGARLARPRQVINLHKLSVGPLVLALMFSTGNFSLAAWTYLVLHGLYGVMWVLKDVYFGDAAWTRPCSITSAVAGFGFLALYYVAPLVLLTPLGDILPGRIAPPGQLSPGLAALAVGCFILGAFFHFVSDCHKHFVLKHQRVLITDGLFALSRNPNYFGEVLIYASFNLVAQHWAAWVVCSIFWLQIFLPNMLRKDRSMSRYLEHAEWVRRTPMLVPSPFVLLRALGRSLGRGTPG